MSNAETTYTETLMKEGAKQRKAIAVFSIVNTILLLGIVVLVVCKTCACV